MWPPQLPNCSSSRFHNRWAPARVRLNLVLLCCPWEYHQLARDIQGGWKTYAVAAQGPARQEKTRYTSQSRCLVGVVMQLPHSERSAACLGPCCHEGLHPAVTLHALSLSGLSPSGSRLSSITFTHHFFCFFTILPVSLFIHYFFCFMATLLFGCFLDM